MDEMPVDQLIPQETPPANPQNRFPLKWALISLAILVVTIGVVLGIRKVNTLNTNAATTKVVKNARLTMKTPSVPQPPLEFGSRASYERYVASQKIPARVKNNIFVDSRLRFGNTNGTDSTDQNPVDDELKPMTITSTKIICPDNSTLAGCDYIGGDGLQKAIDEAPTGSEIDARRLLLKAGSYTRLTGNIYSTYLADGIKSARQALYLAGGDEGKSPKYLKIESETPLGAVLDGANSVGGEGVVILSGRVDFEKVKIHGVHGLKLANGEECAEKDLKTNICGFGHGVVLKNNSKSVINLTDISANAGVTLKDEAISKITWNKIINNKDAGINLQDKSITNITNNEIVGNNYGITLFDNTISKITWNKIINNKERGINLQDKSITNITNNEIARNISGLNIYHNSQTQAINNTFADNQRGIVVQEIQSTVVINLKNNVISNTTGGVNKNLGAGYAYYLPTANTNILDFRGNWSWQNDFDFGGFEKAPQWLTPDKLNRVADPMFVDPEHGDFHLKPNSPAKTAGVGGVEIGAYGNAQSPKSVKTVSVLTYLSADGTTAFVSECDGLKGTPNLADCTKPTQYSLTQIRQNGPANQSYVGISNYVYKQDTNTNVLLQSLLDKNSTKAWYRRCSFNYGDRLNYDSCNDWSEVDTSAFQVPGAKKMAGIEGFIEKKGFDTVYTQSLIANDGVTSYGRSCKVNGEVVNFSSCSAWVEGSLENVAIPANITARFTEIDSWYSDSSSYYQALVSQRGDSLLVRYCPVVNSGVRWTSCESFENIPMASIPGAPSQVSGLDSFSYQIAQ